MFLISYTAKILCVPPPHVLLVLKVAYATVYLAITGSHLLNTFGDIAVLNFSGVSGLVIEKIYTTLVLPINNLSLKRINGFNFEAYRNCIL